ncbi:carboxymuconolactone decarboxylase family protein [Galbibacter pacificus]|uniref:Carboxymuconolactone decarboxylase family protein n=1 Tax=Galbibacter pacificus TaxID=2996052 RepID=A0ABT6FQA0_9FLAO|nr:carboxymuconolactone decarboxylase family protein [Galbibacter pacificus]MDG3582091.1 carboxymuconolactone decarboxylase family protein [Galbibacter pacificus]MDG3585433.1 carboxymuconolactone decarboxylase family protein [Galbibacter pacificus]
MHIPIVFSAFSFLFFTVGVINPVNASEGTWFQETLTEKDKSLILVASYTANGNLKKLKSALNDGLDNGWTVNELKEAIVYLYTYCGFPRSIRGLQTFITVLDDRKAKGIKDIWGPKASPIKDERAKYDRGKANLYKLVGTKLDGPKKGYAQFSPEIEVFLKEHLFADIFERDVLTYKERELVTISVIASIQKAEPMLRSHMNICLIQGWTEAQLHDFTKIIKHRVGKQEGNDAQTVLNELLQSKK